MRKFRPIATGLGFRIGHVDSTGDMSDFDGPLDVRPLLDGEVLNVDVS